jgi:hypothetical protein
MMHDFASSAFPRAGVAFSDMHIALAQVVAGNDAALEARARQMDELARKGRYSSGPCVPAVSHAFAAFPERRLWGKTRRRGRPAALGSLCGHWLGVFAGTKIERAASVKAQSRCQPAFFRAASLTAAMISG